MFPLPSAMLMEPPGVGGNAYGYIASGAAVTRAGQGSFADSVPYPTGIKAGDILIVQSMLRGTSGVETVTVPSGWTLLDEYLDPAYLHNVIWKRATGSESGNLSLTTSTGGAGLDSRSSIMSAWGGCVLSGNPFTTPQKATANSGTSVDGPSVTMPGVNLLVLDFVATSDNTASMTPPSGYTETYDYNYGTTGVSASYKSIAGAGATGTQTGAASASDRWSVITFALLEKRAAPSFTVSPSITVVDPYYGTGDVLTGHPGTHNGGSETYQWRRDGADISGETGLTYTVQSGDVGTVLTFVVVAYVYANQVGASTMASSAGVTGTGDPSFTTQTRTLSDSSNRTLSDATDRTMSNRTG